ncbi:MULTISPECIES: McrB family protein [Aerosakkonema]|uniref:McrB family protein n=1 Tax=Aerosakkonema TaxID=1246629 RepID=UPI0035B93D63
MLVENLDEFISLFNEFINSYPYTPNGLNHKSAYDKQRQQGRLNFEAILAASESGEDVTEAVLLKLLPYREYPDNKQRLVWIHHTSTPAIDVRNKFEAAGWTQPQDWQPIAQAILNFVRQCNDDPRQLSAACKEFCKLHYSKGFQIWMITPILNALRPNDFLLINNESRLVINYFANTSYEQKLIDYPKINFTGRKLILELAKKMHQAGVPALRDDDLFDMFSHWLVGIKNYNLFGIKKDNFNSELTIPDNKLINLKHSSEKIDLQPEYTFSKCAEDIGFDEERLKQWVRAIKRKKQIILYGSPGTGKTFIAQKLAQHLISDSDGFSELIQFHPAYTYEDFIQGIRPQSQNGQLTYSIVPGRFLELCKKAESREGICVLIIDEINRANLAQVFGELMYLLEYRDKEIPLAGGNTFRIPSNVRIIGTMNTADRSIALVDHALRRRFAFIEIRPNYDVLRNYHEKKNTGFKVDGLIQVLQKLNLAIADKNYELGISFFLTEKLAEDIEDIWKMEIAPYLEEYFFDRLEKVDEFRWDKIEKQVFP